MATQTQVKNFINRIAPIAQEKAKGRTKWSLPSVCIAQCCAESAYGTTAKMINANAILGVKVGNSKVHFGTAWKDKAYSTATKECYDGKTYTNITDLFRAYNSIDDAIEDYYDMLAACSRYRGCLNQADPKTCITAIKNGGYATDPNYITTIMSIIKSNNLTQYDSVVTGRRSALKFGSSGADVVYLQQRLTAKGYDVGAIDGKFGAKTLKAVKRFQAEHNLVVDGIVGAKTWVMLEQQEIHISIKTYSLSKDGNQNISPNFKVKEFRCKDGSDKILIDTDFVQNYLQKICDHFGATVTVNSGYRTATYNKKVGGAANSYHVKGQAFDIVVKGHTPLEVAKYSQSLGIMGIIQYNNFVHIDSRSKKYWARDDNGEVMRKNSF